MILLITMKFKLGDWHLLVANRNLYISQEGRGTQSGIGDIKSHKIVTQCLTPRSTLQGANNMGLNTKANGYKPIIIFNFVN